MNRRAARRVLTRIPMAEMEQPIISEAPRRGKPDYFGCVIGLLAFLGGVALLLFTFSKAFEMFGVPPDRALHIPPGQPMNLELAGQSFAGLIFRVLLLLIMALIGSMVANRGIKLYLAGRQEMFEGKASGTER